MKKFLKYNPGGRAVIEAGEGVDYYFFPHGDLSLAEVEEKDVPVLLTRVCGCSGCGGNPQRCVSEATPEEIKRWQG